jgi:hypothetical protein
MKRTRDEYENEPVHYCGKCLSLNIKHFSEINLDVCIECGDSETKKAPPEIWNKLYTDLYGDSFLDINKEHYPQNVDLTDFNEDDIDDYDVDYEML